MTQTKNVKKYKELGNYALLTNWAAETEQNATELRRKHEKSQRQACIKSNGSFL